MAGVIIRQSLAKLTVAHAFALGDKLIVRYQGKTVFSGNPLRSFTGQDPRRAIAALQDESRQQHGVLNPLHSDHSPVIETPSAHDPAVEFHLAIEIEHATSTRIKGPAGLHRRDCRRCRVQGSSILLENSTSAPQRIPQSKEVSLVLTRGNIPGSAVQQNSRAPIHPWFLNRLTDRHSSPHAGLLSYSLAKQPVF